MSDASRCRVQLERDLYAALQRYYSVASRAATTNEINTQIRRALACMLDAWEYDTFLVGGGPRFIPSCVCPVRFPPRAQS